MCPSPVSAAYNPLGKFGSRIRLVCRHAVVALLAIKGPTVAHVPGRLTLGCQSVCTKGIAPVMGYKPPWLQDTLVCILVRRHLHHVQTKRDGYWGWCSCGNRNTGYALLTNGKVGVSFLLPSLAISVRISPCGEEGIYFLFVCWFEWAGKLA
ncbi:hypothetical protein LZ30DRAFT_4123 [Colletotrichum cereale]|nr:hypothetical protein LZ30DRAFT_4123 [Colletotrichum cereale]